MRRALMLSGLGLGLVAAVVWAMGGAEPLSRWAADQQRAVQDSLAAAVRALRAGTPGAWAGLLTVCFGYGVVHALGPGHGKAVIGAYGMASRVPLLRLSVLALSASLAQAGVAVVLVAAGAALLGWTRPAMERFAETAMLPVSHLLVAALGLWLVLRGAFGLRRQARAGQGGRIFTTITTTITTMTMTMTMTRPAAVVMPMAPARKRWLGWEACAMGFF
jgi:ABC-type nickel/cobalt efflux system permease component RcnA